MKKRYYIGLANSVHDPAIAIVSDNGDILFSEGIERYLQNKRALNIAPDHFVLIRELVKKYAKDANEFVIAKTWSNEMLDRVNSDIEALEDKEKLFNKYLSYIDDITKYDFSYGKFMSYSQKRMLQSPGIGFAFEISSIKGTKAKIIRDDGWEHHLTHAATACLTSGLDNGLCVILDGYGEENSVSIYEYNGKKTRLEEIFKYHKEESLGSNGSLGMFYSMICKLCGFDPLKGEEWKVMGLSGYGKLDEKLYSLLKKFIWVEDISIKTTTSLEDSIKVKRDIFQYQKKENQDFMDIVDVAFTAQKVYEDVLFEFLSNCFKKYQNKNIIYGGGCALNSKANGMIIERTPFENLHIFSAPGDDGNALGAALLSYYSDKDSVHLKIVKQSPYLGNDFSREKLNQAVKYSNNVTYVGEEQYKLAAECLKNGQIIIWANGRAEFGPRALGNRSILANPVIKDIKERLNNDVKFRERFRPFAPSILEDYEPYYFDSFQESPYMERTLKYREEVCNLIPGVVHVDKTGRLQTVSKEWNPVFYKLIAYFYDLTEIPMLLNTSLNVMGKPIINSVEDALGVFYTSGVDAMFIDGYYFKK